MLVFPLSSQFENGYVPFSYTEIYYVYSFFLHLELHIPFFYVVMHYAEVQTEKKIIHFQSNFNLFGSEPVCGELSTTMNCLKHPTEKQYIFIYICR